MAAAVALPLRETVLHDRRHRFDDLEQTSSAGLPSRCSLTSNETLMALRRTFKPRLRKPGEVCPQTCPPHPLSIRSIRPISPFSILPLTSSTFADFEVDYYAENLCAQSSQP